MKKLFAYMRRLMKLLPAHPWRGLFGALGGLIFLIFLIPAPFGIRNIANFLGMTAGAALCLCAVFWLPVRTSLRRLWKKRLWRVLLSAAAAVTLFALVLLTVLFCRVAGKMNAQPAREGTLIVLGCQVRRGEPSLLLRYRIDAAEEYLSAHPDVCAILSGGQGPGEDISEAECMYRVLVERGIAAERLYLEDRSTTTWENLTFSQQLLTEEELPEPVIIVSNDFHIYRSLDAAWHLGIDAEGLAAKSAWYSRPTFVLREAFALLYYYVFN